MSFDRLVAVPASAAAPGVAVGVLVLGIGPIPPTMRAGIGAVLVLYAIHGLTRPALPAGSAPAPLADSGVGFLNGMLGGMTGLAGIIVVIWSGLRGWPKDVQRASVSADRELRPFAMKRDRAWRYRHDRPSTPLKLFVLGLPVLLARHLARAQALRPSRRGRLSPCRSAAVHGDFC